MRNELTDEQVDFLLERFDQTDPKLQRRIIARMLSDDAAREAYADDIEGRAPQATKPDMMTEFRIMAADEWYQPLGNVAIQQWAIRRMERMEAALMALATFGDPNDRLYQVVRNTASEALKEEPAK
jgi:prophage DNA circulation protein